MNHLTAQPALTCAIALRDLRILADIGVRQHEIGHLQPLVLHVTLAVKPPEHDTIEQVFDYARIKTMAEALGRERIALIETFARRVAEACLRDARVLGVAVTVEKPHAVPGAMASVTIRMGARIPGWS